MKVSMFQRGKEFEVSVGLQEGKLAPRCWIAIQADLNDLTIHCDSPASLLILAEQIVKAAADLAEEEILFASPCWECGRMRKSKGLCPHCKAEAVPF